MTKTSENINQRDWVWCSNIYLAPTGCLLAYVHTISSIK